MARMPQGKTRPGQDCYFFVYSSCSRGNACPFRHEPAALTNETVCTYWLAGNCSKPHCIFRHLEGKKGKQRNVTPCYWETQPQGCSKPHCPFLHQVPKDPVDQPLPVVNSQAAISRSPSPGTQTAVLRLDSGSIIVNPAKLERLQKVLPVSLVQDDFGRGARRMVVPAGAGHLARRAVTGGIKTRLGGESRLKERLGNAQEARIQLVEEWDPEEDRLRKFAVSSIDLRGRLEPSPRRTVREGEDSDEEALYLLKKQRKLAKREKRVKEEMKLEKILKKEEKVRRKLQKKEKEKLKSRLGSVISTRGIGSTRSISTGEERKRDQHLPSASDYSDLESPDEKEIVPQIMSVVSRPQPSSKEKLREERKKRLLQRVVEREEDKSRKKRKAAKQSYAAKVLGSVVGVRDPEGELNRDSRDTASGIKSRLGLRNDQGGVQRVKRERGENSSKRKLLEEKAELLAELREKKAKMSKISQEGVVKSQVSLVNKSVKAANKKSQLLGNVQDVLNESHSSLLGVNTSQEGTHEEIEGDVLKELDDFINE